MTVQISNQDVAQVLQEIGDILEIQNESRFRIVSYRRAAESVLNLSQDINDVWREGNLRSVSGIGEAIAQKIDELLRTGHLRYLERLWEQVPPGVVRLIEIPDVGPAKARVMWERLGIASVEEAEAAAQEGRLRELPGFGARTEAKILAGIAGLRQRRASGRTPIGEALPLARQLLAQLQTAVPDLVHAEVAGSLRRWRDTIGDVDLVVASDQAEPVMEAFRELPQVAETLLSGPTKTSVRLRNGLQVDLRVVDPGRWGTALQYFTGSQSHNVELRELALRQGWSLSEYSLRAAASGEERMFAEEDDVYRALGLSPMPPEMREGRGELRAAMAGSLPTLVQMSDIKGELHAHSTWSDGRHSMAAMAEAALARGYHYFAITDHSHGLSVTGGVTAEQWYRQREELEGVRRKYPELLLLLGAEVEVRTDGSLDYDDETLAEMDIVVAAVHVGHRQPRDQITQRALNALENPHVDVLAHPSGRILGRREASELDIEKVIQVAAKTGTILEINANPARLDLADVHARRAVELGVPLVINTDAHGPADMELMEYGVAVARRGWAAADNVVNTWPADRLLAYLRARGTRGR